MQRKNATGIILNLLSKSFSSSIPPKFPLTSIIEKSSKMQEETKEEKKIDDIISATSTALLPFDEFVDGLHSWKEALKPAWSAKTFATLYSFLTNAYSSSKVNLETIICIKSQLDLSSFTSCLQRF